MTTVIFIHGTGVRKAQYLETFRRIEKNLHDQRPDINLVPCLWGEFSGAKLKAEGASIPLYDTTKLILNTRDDEDYKTVVWEQLSHNPFFELYLLSLKPVNGDNLNPWEEKPGDSLHSLVENLEISVHIQTKLEEGEIAQVFDEARQLIINSSSYKKALNSASEALGEYRDAVARAIVAQSIVLYNEQQKKYPLVFKNVKLRDEIVELLISSFGDEEYGLGDWIRKQVFELTLPMVSAQISKRRGDITTALTPLLGDILLYQSRGEKIRDVVKQSIEQAKPPVVLLAHSLGGIACVDLLAQESISQVNLLITVGSQAPFLYEIDALSCLEYGQPLPKYFPNWLNIYDLQDFLSYVGENVFPNRIQDILVDNNQPFPKSHSSYWDNRSTWQAIIPRLPS